MHDFLMHNATKKVLKPVKVSRLFLIASNVLHLFHAECDIVNLAEYLIKGIKRLLDIFIHC